MGACCSSTTTCACRTIFTSSTMRVRSIAQGAAHMARPSLRRARCSSGTRHVVDSAFARGSIRMQTRLSSARSAPPQATRSAQTRTTRRTTRKTRHSSARSASLLCPVRVATATRQSSRCRNVAPPARSSQSSRNSIPRSAA